VSLALETRGHFGIGIEGSKTPVNVGTLWRTAGILGASYIFTIGHRYPKQASDTIKAWRHIPLYTYLDLTAMLRHVPEATEVVAVEMDDTARDLASFKHPERACYLLGAEDRGLSDEALARADRVVRLPGSYSLNVAVAGSIVVYDRLAKEVAS
jgi:tRNA G18 (ribose-2'-O)-methylase SpoU